MEVKLVACTRSPGINSRGIITLSVSVPRYIWLEIMTHRRLSKNASSNRAMNFTRSSNMGHYTPDKFYRKSKGMVSSDELIENQELAKKLWEEAWQNSVYYANELEKLGVCKEQYNRLLNTTQYINGLITATEKGWESFLKLRNNSLADKAMVLVAKQIQEIYNNLQDNPELFNYSNYHLPYGDFHKDMSFEEFLISGKTASARCARISYERPKVGKNDEELSDELLKNGHYSPFEHIAYWEKDAKISSINSKQDDRLGRYAWTSLRAYYEHKWETEIENKYASTTKTKTTAK
jgi:thymidylate synthase ThyX